MKTGDMNRSAPWATVPRSMAWHCMACDAYHLRDSLVTQPLTCSSCGASRLVAAGPDVECLRLLHLPVIGGTS